MSEAANSDHLAGVRESEVGADGKVPVSGLRGRGNGGGVDGGLRGGGTQGAAGGDFVRAEERGIGGVGERISGAAGENENARGGGEDVRGGGCDTEESVAG